jgi:hypothetical protein
MNSIGSFNDCKDEKMEKLQLLQSCSRKMIFNDSKEEKMEKLQLLQSCSRKMIFNDSKEEKVENIHVPDHHDSYDQLSMTARNRKLYDLNVNAKTFYLMCISLKIRIYF